LPARAFEDCRDSSNHGHMSRSVNRRENIIDFSDLPCTASN
jgi:hypothetical protein